MLRVCIKKILKPFLNPLKFPLYGYVINPSLLKLSLPLLFVLSFYTPVQAQTQGVQYKIRFLHSIDARASGMKLAGVTGLYIDQNRDELYIIDNSNRRIVITDTDGRFIYQFTYKSIGLTSPPVSIVTNEKGDIYIADGRRIHILNYRGVVKSEHDISKIFPWKKSGSIQSLLMDKEGRLYIGMGGKDADVAVLDSEWKVLLHFDRRNMPFTNVVSLQADEEGVVFLDPANFSVLMYDQDGYFQKRFGRVSSLAGGFSMPSDIAIDRKNDRLLLVDTNRRMVIVFDRSGKFIFEFGGTNWFRWPNAVASDSNGRIYISDATGRISVVKIEIGE